MKRLTVTGDWNVSGGVWILLDSRGRLAGEINPGRCEVFVDDAPLPLPTEPGERFWGMRGNDPQQYWVTVVGLSDSLDADGQRDTRVGYMPTDLRFGWSDVIWANEIRECGLVRLPDPEAAP